MQGIGYRGDGGDENQTRSTKNPEIGCTRFGRQRNEVQWYYLKLRDWVNLVETRIMVGLSGGS